MLTIEALKAWGANVDEGVGRCMGNADFYLMLTGKIISDRQLDDLEAALAAGDTKRAFEIAHGLKGSYGNLSLTPVYAPVAEMTELLRAGTPEGCSGLLAEAKKQKAALDALA